jgi:flagellar protein FlbT
MGLVLKVRPQERILINGSVVRNIGNSQMTVEIENHSDILRGNEVLSEAMANTPVRRACHLMQLGIVDREARSKIVNRIHIALDELEDVMRASCGEHLSRSRRCVRNGDLYNAYRALIPVMKHEEKLFEIARSKELNQKEETA